MIRKCITCGKEENIECNDVFILSFPHHCEECRNQRVVVDPKGELFKSLLPIITKNGYVKVQNLEDIKNMYPAHIRSIDHKYKSNNWLKQHHMPMRRKPFKKEQKYEILDEFCFLYHNKQG